MWFHAKKSKETLKKSKSLILQCKFGSRAQKWPKIAKKTDHSIAIYSFFCMVWYILDAPWWILMSRRFRICVTNWGRGYFHYIPVRCAPVLAVLAVMHAFCLRPDYRYLVCRIATYLSVFYNPIAICSKLSVYCYFVRNCLCVGILFKIALVFAAKTIMLEHCPIFVVFVVTYT